MLMGLWWGISPRLIERKIVRLAALRAEVTDNIAEALADREAAIREIREEILEITELKGRL
jgi:hypothetical protein